MKVVICLNTAWNLVNFRAGLIRALVAAGYEVAAVAPDDKYADGLKALGCRFVPLHMENGGTNPVQDAMLTWRFLRLFTHERPDVYLGYTVKPNVYGSLAAHIMGIPVINNIAGLGAVFIRGGLLVRVVRWLYRTALKRSAKVFFQNPDDRALFIEGGLVRAEVTELLPGSGIDLTRFVPVPLSSCAALNVSSRTRTGIQNASKSSIADQVRNDDSGSFRFLLISRMLRDKGVGEYVEAARQLRQRWSLAEFCLLGFLDVQNPAAISRAEMEAWVAEGVVNYLGVSDDVRTQIATADCVVLPSYREGTPRTLLEAAAMARPIITTDAVGCREVVDDGVNGYLCQVRDAKNLADKMEQMLRLSPDQRTEMGLRGRAKMEAEFDEQIVIDKYLAAIAQLTNRSRP
ncbi:MAG: glycosyltransferase family 4 protein [Limnohabitans sp.]